STSLTHSALIHHILYNSICNDFTQYIAHPREFLGNPCDVHRRWLPLPRGQRQIFGQERQIRLVVWGGYSISMDTILPICIQAVLYLTADRDTKPLE
ncbi:hypothetical protein BDQ12DRAFT_80484, partial [Crucibulum laeve]